MTSKKKPSGKKPEGQHPQVTQEPKKPEPKQNQDIEPAKLLKEVELKNFKTMVVLGVADDNKLQIMSSSSNPEKIVWLLELAKSLIFKMIGA